MTAADILWIYESFPKSNELSSNNFVFEENRKIYHGHTHEVDDGCGHSVDLRELS